MKADFKLAEIENHLILKFSAQSNSAIGQNLLHLLMTRFSGKISILIDCQFQLQNDHVFIWKRWRHFYRIS